MKKIIFALLLIILLIGCAKPKSSENNDAIQENSEIIENENTAPTFNPPNPKQEVNSDSFFSNLAEAFSSPDTVKCTMNLENVKSTMWIESEDLFSSESVVNGQTSFMLYKKPYIYFWSTETDQGMKFDTDKVPPNQQVPVQGPPADPEKIEEIAQDVQCKKATAPSDAFTVPSNIEFLDFNQVMANIGQ